MFFSKAQPAAPDDAPAGHRGHRDVPSFHLRTKEIRIVSGLTAHARLRKPVLPVFCFRGFVFSLSFPSQRVHNATANQ